MSSFKAFSGSLGCLLLFSISTTAYAESSFKKTLNPVGHTYTQEVLKGVRAQQPQVSALPNEDATFGFLPFFPFVSRPWDLNIGWTPDNVFSPISFSGGLVTKYLMLQVGIDGSLEDILNDKYDNILKGNLILGKLYKSPTYFRIGRDYMPLGRHFSEIIPSQNVITHGQLQAKVCVGEIGTGRANDHSEWQASFSVFGVNDFQAAGLKGQYSAEKLIPLASFGLLERYIIGGGFGGGLNHKREQFSILLNLYGDADFSIGSIKDLGTRFEYMYDNVSPNHHYTTNAFHWEIAKYYKQMPLFKWHVPNAVIVGVEVGTRIVDMQVDTAYDIMTRTKKYHYNVTVAPQQKSFVVYKLAFWKQRINLLVGGEWNLAAGSKGLAPLAKVGISL